MRFSKRQRTLGRARHPWSTLAWTAYRIRWLPAVYTRCRHKMATGLLGGPRTSSNCERSSQSTVWLLGPSTTAATVRLRLGVGIGWNAVEYEALGEDFSTRGARIEEQIEVMRLLWSREVVSFEGKYHRIDEAGINPLPVQRPIPVWMGARADVGLRRTARMSDGWFPLGPPDERMREAVRRLRDHVEEAGREPESVGIEARIDVGRVPPEEWIVQTEAWRSLGATHISINTMNAGLGSPQDHVESIRRYKEALGE
jgi:alkanesulfonate monooxygenase SsuD/methylene tetrahydromethanopterin reductase-like flavin-dependent oxidoreductase (luciferase family)